LNHNNILVAVLNCFLFVLSFYLLIRSFDLNRLKFLSLLIINPMLLASLTSVNKEILGIFSVAVFACYLENKNRLYLVPAFAFALLARWPQLVIMVVFMILISRYYSLRKQRGLSLTLMILGISIAYPFMRDLAALNPYYEGVQAYVAPQTQKAFGILDTLNMLQERYAFFLAVFPKVLINYVGNVPRVWDTLAGASYLDYNDVFNTYIVLGHQLSMLFVLVLCVLQRRFTLRSNNVYFILFYSIFFSMFPLINYRTYLPIYLLFCLDLSRHKRVGAAGVSVAPVSSSIDRAGASALNA